MAATEAESLPWEEDADVEGTAEPVFEADVSETAARLAEISAVGRDDAFPLDAFIIPEDTRMLPSGLEGTASSAAPEHTPVTDLADRLEKLSHRMRLEDSQAIISRLASGDKLDTMLAGLLAGLLAAQK